MNDNSVYQVDTLIKRKLSDQKIDGFKFQFEIDSASFGNEMIRV